MTINKSKKSSDKSVAYESSINSTFGVRLNPRICLVHKFANLNYNKIKLFYSINPALRVYFAKEYDRVGTKNAAKVGVVKEFMDNQISVSFRFFDF